MKYVIADPNMRNVLGKQGENKRTAVIFDFSDWVDEYGAHGTVCLYHKRNTDESAYPCSIDILGSKATWVVSSSDLAIAGSGIAELVYRLADGTIAKSEKYVTYVNSSVNTTENPPKPWEAWTDEVERNAERAESAREDIEALSVSAVTLPTGQDATVTKSGGSGEPVHFTFGLPRGADGNDAPQIDDTQASATNPWSGAKVSQLLSEKADLNQGEENAGKWMLVAPDGTIYPADLPTGSLSQKGIVKGEASVGSSVNATSGTISIVKATNNQINYKVQEFTPIVPSNLDYAVRAGLLSNSQITDADKPTICQTIGAVIDMDAVTMLATITLEESSIVKITGFAADEVYAEVILPKNVSAPGMNYGFYANNSQLCGTWFTATSSADYRKISTLMIQCFGDRYYPTLSQYQAERNGVAIQRFADEYRYIFQSRKLYGKIDEFRTTGQLPAGTVISIYGH